MIAEDSSFRSASGEFTSGLSSRFRLVVIVNAHTDLRYLSLYTFVRPTGSRNDVIRTLWSVRNSNTFHLWTQLYKLAKLITVKKISRLFRRLAEIGLDKKKKENEPDKVNTAATDLAGDFSAIFPQLDRLNFGDVSSKIFTIKPKTSRSLHTLTIPTSFLAQTFGLAVSRQAADQQNTLFRMLSSHPSFCDAGGTLFEHYAHNQLSEPEREPLLAYSPDDEVCCIPVPAKLIAGTTALGHIQPPHD